MLQSRASRPGVQQCAVGAVEDRVTWREIVQKACVVLDATHQGCGDGSARSVAATTNRAEITPSAMVRRAVEVNGSRETKKVVTKGSGEHQHGQAPESRDKTENSLRNRNH